MVYIFDFFGVISSEVAPFWFKEHLPEMTEAELREKYVVDADIGNVPTEEFYTNMGKLVGRSAEQISKEWHAFAKVNTDVVAIVEELSQHHRVALLSNAPAGLIRSVLQENDLERLFEEIVISAEVHMVKPNDDIFLHMLDILNVPASETMFIDDSLKNTETAERLGMQTIHYNSIEQIQALLQ